MTDEEASAALVSAIAGSEVAPRFNGFTVTVPPTEWLAALRHARDVLGVTYFDFLTGVDESDAGFAVVVHLYAPPAGPHLHVRTVVTNERPHLDSATGVFAGAAWHERETHEMFGIFFEGHPHLVTLLLPDGFEGNPLRKDFVLAARATKSWPGAKEPGEGHEAAAEGKSRRANVPTGLPADLDSWPPPVPVETTHPEGRP